MIQPSVHIAAARSTSFAEVVVFWKKQLPNLTVNDLPMQAGGREVLADFSDRGIRQLGVVEFSLEERVWGVFGGDGWKAGSCEG